MKETLLLLKGLLKLLENRIYKHMTTVLRNIYFDVLDNIVDNYNRTFRITV